MDTSWTYVGHNLDTGHFVDKILRTHIGNQHLIIYYINFFLGPKIGTKNWRYSWKDGVSDAKITGIKCMYIGLFANHTNVCLLFLIPKRSLNIRLFRKHRHFRFMVNFCLVPLRTIINRNQVYKQIHWILDIYVPCWDNAKFEHKTKMTLFPKYYNV